MTAVHTRAIPALLLLIALAPSARAEDVQWQTDYAKALEEATRLERPLFINVGSDDCYWCKQLDQRTFIDPELQRLLADRFVTLKVNGSRNRYIVDALRIQSYPTLVMAASDGTILAYKEGFLEAAPLKKQLHEVLARVTVPEWMKRDYEAAVKASQSGDDSRAISLLKAVVEDGKDRPVQAKARKLLGELEKRSEAESKAKSERTVGKLASRSSADEFSRQAAELLASARQDYKAERFLICLDRCELLADAYPDTEEAKEATELATKIKDNPEWARRACDQLGDRLAVLYLSLADSWVKKGQPQQAVYYLERVMKSFPATKHAEQANVKLTRLRGAPEPKP